MKICKYASVQVCKYAYLQICINASMQVCNFTSMLVCMYTNMHECKYASMYVWIYANVQACKYTATEGYFQFKQNHLEIMLNYANQSYSNYGSISSRYARLLRSGTCFHTLLSPANYMLLAIWHLL